jgi:hypothetical protein
LVWRPRRSGRTQRPPVPIDLLVDLGGVRIRIAADAEPFPRDHLLGRVAVEQAQGLELVGERGHREPVQSDADGRRDPGVVTHRQTDAVPHPRRLELAIEGARHIFADFPQPIFESIDVVAGFQVEFPLMEIPVDADQRFLDLAPSRLAFRMNWADSGKKRFLGHGAVPTLAPLREAQLYGDNRAPATVRPRLAGSACMSWPLKSLRVPRLGSGD